MTAKRPFFSNKLTALLQAAYWERPYRWLTFLTFALFALVGFYLYLHSRTGFNFQDRYGWETIQLRENRVQTLNYIFLNRSLKPSKKVTAKQAAVEDTSNAAGDPDQKADTMSVTPQQQLLTTTFDVHQPPNKDRIELAIEYLTNELGSGIFNLDSAVTVKNSKKYDKRLGSVDDEQMAHIGNILGKLPADVCVGFLLEQRFRVRSYFWLIGGPAYWEVIFWSMFGVLASLLYMVSTATREDNTQSQYKSSDVAYQFAKLLYAPLATLVIIFAYHILQGENNSMVDIQAGKGMLFFSFIAGFYSGRLMMFLDRLKEILLPFDPGKPKGEETVEPNEKTLLSQEDVSLIVRVNSTSVSAEILNDINEKFLDKTNTTLTKDGVIVYQFEKTEDDQAGDFIARGVKPGTYLLKSFLSIPIVESMEAEVQDPLVVSGNIPIANGGDLTEELNTFSVEETVVISTDPDSRQLQILLNPDESQG